MKELTYASLFSAAGLGCYGFKMSGYTCVATAELLERRLAVQKANATCSDPEAYYLGDLANDAFLEKIKADVRRRTSDLTFVLATPPCQGMSVANHKKGDELGRNSLVVKSLEFIETLRPRFFVLENVRAFLGSVCNDSDGVQRTIEEAIKLHLAGNYNILSKVVNLKDYGSPSSRTRTLVLGVRRDQKNFTPFDLFPDQQSAPTLRELIGDLPSLAEMGEISETDIFHSFRRYDQRMRPWIADLKPGQSAFENEDPARRPHRVVAGSRVPNKNGNGDKYKRNQWDKVAPCVHTRNDILASQSTIHPVDDRVFSVRELSRMMGVPPSFRWVNFSLDELNALPLQQKQEFIRRNDSNIRQCLGEGVPTPVFRAIAEKAKELLLSGSSNLGTSRIYELGNANPRQKELAAYYTRQDTIYSLLSLIPLNKKNITVLEPSVGSGAFLPQIISFFSSTGLAIDIVDIDPKAIKNAKEQLSQSDGALSYVRNVYVEDFLEMQVENKYDLVVGNPPFGSSGTYGGQHRLKDLYAKFLEKSLAIAEYVAFVLPKTFLSGTEFQSFRNWITSNCTLLAIEDLGESAFDGIKIETIGIVLKSSPSSTRKTVVKSRLFNSYEVVDSKSIQDPKLPVWLLYRTDFFNRMLDRLRLGSFTAYRDRSLTRSKLMPAGEIPVIKARQISEGGVVEPELFCNAQQVPSAFWRVTENKTCLVVPNLSYYPRAALLPKLTYVDGSAAVLIPTSAFDVKEAIDCFLSKEFFYFYRIARNFSVRSLNIDSCSTYFWGTPTSDAIPRLAEDVPPPSSKSLFLRI